MTGWLYEDEQQVRDAPARLQACAIDIQRSIAAQASIDANGTIEILAENFRRQLSLSADDSYNPREQAMYDKLPLVPHAPAQKHEEHRLVRRRARGQGSLIP